MSSQIGLLLDFLHITLFLINLASTGGPHEISRGLDSTGLKPPNGEPHTTTSLLSNVGLIELSIYITLL